MVLLGRHQISISYQFSYFQFSWYNSVFWDLENVFASLMFFGVCYLALDLSLVPEVGGASSEFPVNMHQKEQLHESVMSMMQSRNLPVSLVLYVPYYYRQSDTIYHFSCVHAFHLAGGEIFWIQLGGCIFITSSATTAACSISKWWWTLLFTCKQSRSPF